MGATKEYSNGEVTIVWKPDLCIHSAKCVEGLPQVFNPKAKPWINAEAATTAQLANQVKKCPSGALSYYMNQGHTDPTASNGEEQGGSAIKTEVMANGPLMVYGEIEVKMPDGSTTTKKKAAAFCRCGYSGNKPFCDGSHSREGFKG